MIVDLDRKKIFVASPKCASTAIETVLQQEATIALTESRHGKHMPLHAIEAALSHIIPDEDIRSFAVFGSIRHPLTWLVSIYRSHQAEQFAGSELSSRGVLFQDFINHGLDSGWDHLTPQVERFRWSDGELAECLWIPLADASGFLSRYWFDGQRQIKVPWKNIAFGYNEVPIECDEQTIRRIARVFAEDISQHLFQGGMLGPAAANPELHEQFVSTELTKLNGGKVSDSAGSARVEDVVHCYRALLGRDPESTEAIEHHLRMGSLEAILAGILASEEYLDRVRQRSDQV